MNKVIILDFGSQYTQLIARRVREQGVYCEVRSCLDPCTGDFAALILSGGPASVLEEDAPAIDEKWFEHQKPILGICYGMQLMAHRMGGQVRSSENREYGLAKLSIHHEDKILSKVKSQSEIWMSHGDDVAVLPNDFQILAKSEEGVVAAIGHIRKPLYGLQFHPEVTHSECGVQLIKNFLFDVAGLSGNWTMQSFVEEKSIELKQSVPTGNILCAMSGGVDSSVTATLLHRIFGSRLHCVFVACI